MANPAGNSGFRILVNTLTYGIEATSHFTDDIESDLLDVVTNMVDDARAEAPWQDNTGDARAELDADIDEHEGVYTVTLSHGVDYGQWLETIQSGQFAIIMPTIEKWAPEILKSVGNHLVDKG